jgi:CubicO group peptidase (beta-lactamase class C family)
LRLDDPIRKHLPRFAVKDAEASARATIRDTLTHVGGWEGDLFDDPSSGDDALERIVERMATLEQTARVGEMWGYNNAGFYVAGRVIEIVTGKPFERAIKELVFDPLGIEQAYYFPADVMTRRFVVGHGARKDLATVLTPWALSRAANAAGGITTNVASLLRYAAFHMGDGTRATGRRLLSSSSLTQMRSPVVAKAGTDETMGLTWHLTRVGGLVIAEHGGRTNGQTSWLRLVPDRRFAVAVVTNSSRGDALIVPVLRVTLDAYFGVAQPPASPVAMSPDALAEYVGTYRRQFQDVSVTIDGDALKIEVTPKMPSLDGKVPPPPPAGRIGFFATDRLITLEGPTAGEPTGEFIRDASGRVAWLRGPGYATGRIHRRVEPAAGAGWSR